MLSNGETVEMWKIPKGKRAIAATENVLKVAHEFVALDSKDPEDTVKKQWIVRNLLSAHLSVQQMKQAHELLDNVTEKYGLAPSTLYYDRFTKYFAVRGERERESGHALIFILTADTSHSYSSASTIRSPHRSTSVSYHHRKVSSALT
jgi:hypothetical protein